MDTSGDWSGAWFPALISILLSDDQFSVEGRDRSLAVSAFGGRHRQKLNRLSFSSVAHLFFLRREALYVGRRLPCHPSKSRSTRLSFFL